MSIDRPSHREQHQDYRETSDREQRYFGDIVRLNEHELIAIDEWPPGTEPTPYEINLTDGFEYRTRYWRCRNCGQERNRRRELIDHCETTDPSTPLEAGGYGYLTTLSRLGLSSQLNYIDRNHIEKWFHTLKMCVNCFHNS